MDSYTVSQGDALSYIVTIKDSQGVIINSSYTGGGYSGAEPLSTRIWTGDDSAPLFTATTTWISPAAGTVLVSIPPAQTASLPPGVFQATSELVDAGTNVEFYQAYLTINPAPSGIVAATHPTIVTIAEALASVPGFTNLLIPDQVSLVYTATDYINNYCHRIFPLSVLDETYPLHVDRSVRLKQYPARSIARLCTGMAWGLTITNSTLVRCTATVVPSTTVDDPAAEPMSLVLAGYTAGVQASTTLTLVTYPTLNDLVIAINAVGSGWSATLGDSSYATTPTTDIDNDWGTKGVSAAGTPLRIYVGDVEDYDLDPLPGIVTIRRTPIALGMGYPGYYGFLYPGNAGRWAGPNPGRRGVRCIYTAGFDAATMPYSLKRAAFILIQVLYQRTAVGLKTTEKTVLETMTYGPHDLIGYVSDLLEPFRRKRIF